VPALSEDSEDQYYVSVEGGQEKVVVTPDAAKMNANGIPMAALLSALSNKNFNPGPSAGYNSVHWVEVGDVAPSAPVRRQGPP